VLSSIGAFQLLPNYQRLLGRLKAELTGTPLVEARVAHSAIGATVTSRSLDGDSKVEEIRWAEVVEVAAYKRDCFSVDLMCVALIGHENALEVSEGMKGWNELLDNLNEYLPGCRNKDTWYQEVMLPPFKENRTIIFRRQ
jgi:hypothetical protein